jgi:hypothetical protein
MKVNAGEPSGKKIEDTSALGHHDNFRFKDLDSLLTLANF